MAVKEGYILWKVHKKPRRKLVQIQKHDMKNRFLVETFPKWCYSNFIRDGNVSNAELSIFGG